MQRVQLVDRQGAAVVFLPSFDIRNLVDAAVTYLLSANWTAGDQTFTHNQVLDTTAEGVQVGSFKVTDTFSGTVKIVSNALEIMGASSTGWEKNVIISVYGILRYL